jgi:exodeoxyribonuclease-3
MQETKLADDAFPALTFQALGYDSAHHGQGQWNGVAILSKVGLGDVVANFADGESEDADARLLSATCAGIRITSIYVPNGRSLDSEHYQYKLAWLARLRAHIAANSKPSEPVIVCGDFNIAPDDRDVWDPAKMEGATHVSPPERAELGLLRDWGLDDVFRRFHDDDQIFSWWDYRAGDFHQGRGLRIDLILGSQPIVERSRFCIIDRNARKGSSPSDHAPVVLDLAAA